MSDSETNSAIVMAIVSSWQLKHAKWKQGRSVDTGVRSDLRILNRRAPNAAKRIQHYFTTVGCEDVEAWICKFNNKERCEQLDIMIKVLLNKHRKYKDE